MYKGENWKDRTSQNFQRNIRVRYKWLVLRNFLREKHTSICLSAGKEELDDQSLPTLTWNIDFITKSLRCISLREYDYLDPFWVAHLRWISRHGREIEIDWTFQKFFHKVYWERHRGNNFLFEKSLLSIFFKKRTQFSVLSFFET